MKYASFIIIAFATLIVACESSQQKPAKASQSNAGAKIKPTKTANKVTIADVEHGIREYIDRQTAAADGYLDIQKDTFDLHLKLVRVHTEYLSVLSPNEFFACVDLATASGDVYDVDFFLQGSKDSMTVTRTDVHKLNGRPYYTWKQRPDKTWYTVPVARSSNRLLGVIEGTDRFTFTYEVQLPEINGTAAIWLPVAGSDQYQTIEIISRQFPDNYQIIKDKEYNNSIFYAKLGPADSRSKIILQYRVTRHEKAPYPDPEGQVTRYLAANSLLPVNTRFRTLAADIIAKRQAASDLEKARALYDYVSDNLRYAKQGTYGTGDANYACDAKSGNCTEFHSLFISLARSAGIPARFAVGAAIP
ncbi:MAG TPA: transglutaminase domain-containing protein, partial [Flammeovirgaceae bacterium]|nr:transglutaminase domain-containing protein [Flammeovirgaceae bacterium]